MISSINHVGKHIVRKLDALISDHFDLTSGDEEAVTDRLTALLDELVDEAYELGCEVGRDEGYNEGYEAGASESDSAR